MARTPNQRPAVPFAFPIANEEILVHFPPGTPIPDPIPDSIYAPYTGKISAGRAFRQTAALRSPDAAQFSAGLEINFTDDELASRVYVWFPGILRWSVAKTDESTGGISMRASLRLEPDVNALAALTLKPRTLEAPPALTIYENLEAADVKACIAAVIRTAYDLTASLAPADWHPVLGGQFSPKAKIKQFIDDEVKKAKPADDAAKSAAIDAAIEKIMVSFMAGTNNAVALRMQAGDFVGHAATTNDPDPAKARQMIFFAFDPGGQFINPAFYLHLYSKATAGILNVTIIADNQPLLVAFPAIKAPTRPPPRIETTNADGDPEVLIPVARLGFNRHLPQKNKFGTIEWKWAPATVSTGPGPDDVKFDTTPHQSLTDAPANDPRRAALPAFWTKYGDEIATMCKEMAVPCELATAIVGHESRWQDKPDVYRLEPLTHGQRAALFKNSPNAQTASDLELKYEYAIGIVSDNNVAVALDAAQAGFKTEVTSTLSVQLTGPRSLALNGLVSKTRSLVVIDDVYRPTVKSNTAAGSPANFYKITAFDERTAKTITIGPGATLYMNLSGVTGGNRTTVEAAPKRSGTLRVLRAHTEKASPFPVTFTVLLDGQPADPSLTTILNTGATDAAEITRTVDVTTAQKVSVQITGGAGNVAPIEVQVEVYLAPAQHALVIVADGTSSGISDAVDIPSPWDPAKVVRLNRAKPLTWEELAQVLDAVKGKGISSPMSPGLMQTLISTALDGLNFIALVDPAMLVRLNIPRPPSSYGDYIREYQEVDANGQPTGRTLPGWLVVARQSIFAGIARMRWGYNNKLPGWELPLVCTNYNANGAKSSDRRYGVATNKVAAGRPEYTDEAAGRVSIAVDFFAALPTDDPVPTVRLKR